MKKNNIYLSDAKDFLVQAENELQYTHWDFKGGYFSPVCFWSQQVAEKALKAFLLANGIPLIKKHFLETALLKETIRVDASFESMRENCRRLDQYYFPVRYPNGRQTEKLFTKEDAQKAIAAASVILNFVKGKVKMVSNN